MEMCGDAFKKVMEEFRRDLSDDQKQMFSSTNIEEVKDAIEKIQEQVGTKKRLRNFKSLTKFLRGMKSLEQLVQVFLQVSEVGAFIWGPIKFSMTVASTRSDYFEMLLDVYHKISDVLDGVEKYDRIFKHHCEARVILEEYFRGVLRFHLEVLKVFSKPGWKKCFTYTWPTFKSRFQPIIDSLSRYKNLLSDEKQTVIIEEVQELSAEFKKKFSELMKAIDNKDKSQQASRHDQLRAQILAKLNPLDYEKDQIMAMKQRHASKSGDWVLQGSQFTDWISGESETNNVLYLHGKPGSGKTTLTSRIIDHMRSNENGLEGAVVFFYFKHELKNNTQRTISDMFRAIISQLIDQDDSIIEAANQNCANKMNSEAQFGVFLEECTQQVLASQKRAWIILDGLDECNEKHGGANAESSVIGWFLEEVLPKHKSGSKIRLLISGQRDGEIEAILSKYPSINLDTAEGHISDIDSYTRAQAAEIQQRFELEADMGINIAEKITSVAQGMFLYAKVVLENLLLQESEHELEEELKQENLPRGLEAAYERVVMRILDHATPPKRKSAEKILGWLVCSARPLRWREIQSLFCIDPGNAICNYKMRRVSKCKLICGSLIDASPCVLFGDENSEQEISLVHPTAGRYLTKTGRVCLTQEHLKMSIFCCQYLTSPPFSEEPHAHSITEMALTGYYGLLDYSIEFWGYHTQVAVAPCRLDSTDRKTVIDAATHLIKTFISNENILETLECDKIKTIELVVGECQNTKYDTSNILQQVLAIRKAMETINLTNEADEALKPFLNLNGCQRFKCDRIMCKRFTVGFRDRQDRDLHMRQHERPFTCAIPTCHARANGFSSQYALDTHMNRSHIRDSDLALFPESKERRELDIYGAASRGNLERIKVLHKSGTSLSKGKGGVGFSPFVLAARHGHVEVCKYIISQGIPPTIGTRMGGEIITPLSEAIKKKDLELFLVLFTSKERESEETCERALIQAVALGSELIVNEVLLALTPTYIEHNIRRIFNKYTSPLIHALGQRSFTEDSVFPTIQCLHRLICWGFPDLYEPDGTTPRPRDEVQDDRNSFKKLHSSLFSRMEGLTVLDEACGWGMCTVSECLLGLFQYSHLNIMSGRHRSPLHHLALGGYNYDPGFRARCANDMAKKLATMNNGEMTQVKDNEGRIALHCVSRSYIALEVLIHHTENLNEENYNNDTPLECFMAKRAGKWSVPCVIALVQSQRVDLTRPGSNKGKLLEYANTLDQTDKVTLVNLLSS